MFDEARLDPLVSILVPVFNREKYIVDCVNSVLKQDFENFEIIIVDNQSTDGTWALCQGLAASDSRVKIFQNDTNIGPVMNWVKCVEASSGQYSKFVFSDDLLLPGCLERMCASLEDGSIGFVFSAAKIGANLESCKVAYQNERDAFFSFEEYLIKLFSHLAPLSPGAIMLRTKDLRRNLLLDIPSATPRDYRKNGAGPDVLISLLSARDYGKVACIKEPLVFFRAHEDSFSIVNSGKEVSLGYTSAIAYFLKVNAPRFWRRYIAYSWLLSLQQSRSWWSPRQYLRDFEGKGNMAETVGLFADSVRFISGKIIRMVRG